MGNEYWGQRENKQCWWIDVDGEKTQGAMKEEVVMVMEEEEGDEVGD